MERELPAARPMTSADAVKVGFELDSNWHGHAWEWLWVVPVKGGFELQNIPFYVNGVSFLDVVRGIELDGMVRFRRVVRRSGHSTYRLIVSGGQDSDQFVDAWRHLAAIGCTYEAASDVFLAVDVPPATDTVAVFELLQRGLSQGIWKFEEGHLRHDIRP